MSRHLAGQLQSVCWSDNVEKDLQPPRLGFGRPTNLQRREKGERNGVRILQEERQAGRRGCLTEIVEEARCALLLNNRMCKKVGILGGKLAKTTFYRYFSIKVKFVKYPFLNVQERKGSTNLLTKE